MLLPSGFGADFVIHVSNVTTATLLGWDGANWTNALPLDSTTFSSDGVRTRLIFPFGALGLSEGDGLKLLAMSGAPSTGSEQAENELSLWSAIPAKNPLTNGVVQARRVANDLQLQQVIDIPALSSGVVPNAGVYDGSDVRIDLQSDSGGTTLRYRLHPTALTLGQVVDSDLDGVIEPQVGVIAEPQPVGDGSTINYTVHYDNLGAGALSTLTLDATARGALRFAGGGATEQIVVNDITPQTTSVVTFTVLVDQNLHATAAEFSVTVSDSHHTNYDQYWVHHKLDLHAPNAVSVTLPIGFVRALSNTLAISAEDAAGVTSSVVEITGIPTGDVVQLPCALNGAAAAIASCLWHLPDLGGNTAYQLRVKAVDSLGNESAWSGGVVYPVDNTAPTIALNAATEAAIADGLLGSGELVLAGTISDDQAAASVELCQVGQSCTTFPSTSEGHWQAGLSFAESDGISETVVLVGVDQAGNRSDPLTRTLRVDIVAPEHSVTMLQADQIAGSVSDGGGVGEVYLRLDRQDGSHRWMLAARTNHSWRVWVTDAFIGTTLVTVVAFDLSGNVTYSQAYDFTMPFVVTAVDVVAVSADSRLPFHVLLSVQPLLIVVWILLRRRRQSAR